MAGIGFALGTILRGDAWPGARRRHPHAGMTGAGPWALPIAGTMVIGLLSLALAVPALRVAPFQVSVTWLVAISLMLTGPLQLTLSRYLSDRLSEGRDDLVLPAYHAVALVAVALAGLFGLACVLWLFPRQTALYRALMLAGFIAMCHVWIALAVLSAIRQYKAIGWTIVAGGTVAVAAGAAMRPFGLEGMLGGVVSGQLVLLAGAAMQIYRDYRGRRFLSFAVFAPRWRYPSLMAIGLLLPLGIWADKLMFWWHAGTGQSVIGPLHAAVIYDIPVFVACLSMVPGMAVFQRRIDTDCAAHCDAFYGAVRGGGSLQRIEDARDTMVRAVRLGLYEIVKVQAIASLVLFALGRPLLALLGLSDLHLPLLQVDIIAAGLLVLLLGVLSVHVYLDRRRDVLLLAAGLLILNVMLTWLTMRWGPAWYGYGFALALLIVVALGLMLLDRRLDRLEYETYMLQ